MSLAIIARVRTSPHPNADRLQLGNVLGFTVIVGMDTKDGDLGIFFPEGLQLSTEYATANDLIRRKDENGAPAGGFFEEHRRVKALKLRGVKSEGYFAPLSSLDFAKGVAWNHQQVAAQRLNEGDRLEAFNGVPICNKYITPATHAARGKKSSSSRDETAMFRKHFVTDQLRMSYHHLKPRDLVVLTLKMHGTSQRVGHVRDTVRLSLFQRMLNFVARVVFGCNLFDTEAWKYLVGSRNVILNIGDRLGHGPKDGGYHDIDFRQRAADPFFGKLRKGETVYYEIVGYERPGVPIMGTVTADGEIKKQYGDQITYHYGCLPGDFAIYVYRITMTTEDGDVIELPWRQVKARCRQLAVNHVPEMCDPFHYCDDQEKIRDLVDSLVEGPDPIANQHPREGVCLRVEGDDRTRIFKHKSFTFGVLEGYIKDDANYVDAEEVA